MLYLLLIFYFIFLIVFLIISALAFYHLWRYGYKGDISKIIIIGYSMIMGAIIVFSLLIMATLDWGNAQFNFPAIDFNIFGS